jgi:para-nitrobenzyl esterase
MQQSLFSDMIFRSNGMGEDCLYLNVWTSATNTGGRQPVMVWLHGGALALGAGSLPAYDGVALARKGAVVVTLNYRLGPFGWLAHPDLSKESGRNASGNYGLMDVIAALQWVQANILGFGGDPRRVTVFGESAGANLTAALVGSPTAKDLFQRVIAQSSGWMGVTMAPMPSLAQAEEDGNKVAVALGGGSLDALRTKSAQDVLKAGASAPRSWQIIVDGRYIPEDLSVTFAQGKQQPSMCWSARTRTKEPFHSSASSRATPRSSSPMPGRASATWLTRF